MDQKQSTDVDSREAVNALRWHHGVIGQPKSTEIPPWMEFEEAFGAALGHHDPGVFECLCPALLLNEFDPERLISVTPARNLPRLRAAAEVALNLVSYDAAGIPNAMEATARLMKIRGLTGHHNLMDDPWNQRPLPGTPEGYYSPFFLAMGLQVVWPLRDFEKQKNWAIQCHYHRSPALNDSLEINS